MSVLAATLAVAREHGLPVAEPRILDDRFNVVEHLFPAPIVAKAPHWIARVRPDAGWAVREVRPAEHAARAGAPVAAPSRRVLPGPHERDAVAGPVEWDLATWAAGAVIEPAFRDDVVRALAAYGRYDAELV